MDFIPFRARRVHFIFKKLFEYSFCAIHPEKYSIYFGYTHLSKEDILRIKTGLVKSLRSNNINGRDFETNGKEIFDFYSQMSQSPLGKTILKEGGKNLGHVLGGNVYSSDFDGYLSDMQHYFTKLQIGAFSPYHNGTHALTVELEDSLFAKHATTKCHFFEGVFEGMLERYTNSSWHVVETSCQSLGEDSCQFECKQL